MIYMGDNVMRITHIESSYSSRRIPWNHLYLHTEVAEQVRPLGLEASTFPKSNPKYQYPKGKKKSMLMMKKQNMILLHVLAFECGSNLCICQGRAESQSLHCRT